MSYEDEALNEALEVAEGADIESPLRKLAVERMDNFWKRALRLLAQYKGNKLMALDCLYMAIGESEMIGCETAVDLAIRHFSDKSKRAAVTKCIVMFQQSLNIEPMPGQRGEKGRVGMVKARNKQLKEKNNDK